MDVKVDYCGIISAGNCKYSAYLVVFMNYDQIFHFP